MKESTNLKKTILNACIELIINDGLQKFSLNEVAKKAGVSKGGLLHHYPSKEELIKAIVRENFDTYLDSILRQIKSIKPHPGRTPSIYLQSTEEAISENEEKLVSAILVASVYDKNLMKPFQEFYAQIDTCIQEDGGNTMKSKMIIISIDAIWINQMLEVYIFSKNDWEKFSEEAKRQIQEI
jgi:AcrR family transcriptional regulator